MILHKSDLTIPELRDCIYEDRDESVLCTACGEYSSVVYNIEINDDDSVDLLDPETSCCGRFVDFY